MSNNFSYWGDANPILLPDRATGGLDYWGDGEPSPGELIVSTQTISLDTHGIDGAEAFGTAWLNNTISPSGIASEEAVGEPTVIKLAQELDLSGIDSAEAFGTPQINLTINPVGIASEEALADDNWISANTVLKPSAIDSQEAFGVPTVLRTSVIDLNTAPITGELLSLTYVIQGYFGKYSYGYYYGYLAHIPIVPGSVVFHSMPNGGGTPTIDYDTGYFRNTFNNAIRTPVSGSPNADYIFYHAGITGVEGVGAPVLHCGPVTVAPPGITSLEVVPSPLIWPGPVTVTVYNWIVPELIAARNLITVTSHQHHWPGPGYWITVYVFSCSNPTALLSALNNIYNRIWGSSDNWINSTAIWIQTAINDASLNNWQTCYQDLQSAIVQATNIVVGIPTQEAVGSPTLRRVITPVAIVSQEAVPQPVLHVGPVEINLDDSNDGIGSLAAVGQPQVKPAPWTINLDTHGISSQETFGTPIILPEIRPEAIASEEDVGEPILTCGPVDISPAGIISLEAVGMPLLGLNISRMIGIESEEAFGDLTIECGPVDVLPVAIDSEEEFGEPKINFGISEAGGIESEEAVGEPTLNLVIFPETIISRERVGKPKLKPGPVNIYARSITTDGLVGHPFIKNPERADIIVLAVRRPEAIEVDAGQTEIELFWDEREVVNG